MTRNGNVWVLMCMALLVGTACLCGCRVLSSGTVVEKSGSAYRVTVNSLLLDNHIRVLERSTRRTNGLLDAQVRAKNITNKDVQFEYRYIWLDRDGIKLDSTQSVWKQLALHAKEDGFLKGMASDPAAVDFLMEVRFVHQATRW